VTHCASPARITSPWKWGLKSERAPVVSLNVSSESGQMVMFF